MIILARHGQTPANAALELGLAESRVQGASIDMRLSQTGELQAVALGVALGRFLLRRNVSGIVVHSSDAFRAQRTRDLALAQIALPLEALTQIEPDRRLRELSKGSLEGTLRTEAYPTEEANLLQKTDWHFRHGTPESGGETAYEAGRRWLQWQKEVASSEECVVAFGHGLVTAFGVWMLGHGDEPILPSSLEQSAQYRAANGTALVIDEHEGVWSVADIITPDADDYMQAQMAYQV